MRLQLRVTPYPHEDAGWIVANAGKQLCMFASAYPHMEGNRHPLTRSDESRQGCTPSAVQRFYSDNFIDLMGDALAPPLRLPAVPAAARAAVIDALRMVTALRGQRRQCSGRGLWRVPSFWQPNCMDQELVRPLFV